MRLWQPCPLQVRTLVTEAWNKIWYKWMCSNRIRFYTKHACLFMCTPLSIKLPTSANMSVLSFTLCSADSLCREPSVSAVSSLHSIWLRHLLFHLNGHLKLHFPACHRPPRSLSAARTRGLIKNLSATYYISFHWHQLCTYSCETRADLTLWPHLMRVMISAAVDLCRPPPCVHTYIHTSQRLKGKLVEGEFAEGSGGLFSTISMCPSWGERESNS